MKPTLLKQTIHQLCTHKPILLSAALLSSISIASAEPIENTEKVKLETMQVVARPIIEESQLDAYSSMSSTVTEDQLRDQNAVDLASALRRTPGVQITRFNPVGSFGGGEGGGIFIRGMGASRPGSEIQTYVDEVPFYMPIWGHPLLDILPINGMESITVYKSPQPQVNGNNFASVNLKTKRAIEDGIKGNFRLSGGMLGTVQEQLDVTGKYGDVDFTLAQGFARSNGHRDNSDGQLNNIMGRIGWQFDKNWSVGAQFVYANNEATDPGDSRKPAPAIAPTYDTEATLISVNLAHDYEKMQGDIKFYTTLGSGNWFDREPMPMTPQDTLSSFHTAGIKAKETFTFWEGSEIILGLDNDWIWGDVQNNFASGFSATFNTPTFSITSPYLAVSQNFQVSENWAVTPSAGVRYYSHSQFDNYAAPHAGLSISTDWLTVFTNYSRGINYPGLEAPTLASMIQPLGTTWQTLAPEINDHVEVGFQLSPFDSTQVDVSLFLDMIQNRYIFAFPPHVPFPQFTNIGAYDMYGMEIALQQSITKDWSFFTSLTLLDPSIDNLPYVPTYSVSAGINGKIQKLSINLDMQFQSETTALNRSRNAGITNTEKVSAFTVVNLRTSYPIPMLGDSGEVFVAVENLFNKQYAYRPGYTMPGIWAQVGVSASF